MKIKLLVLDFDGVMTDGRVLVGPMATCLYHPQGRLQEKNWAELGVFCDRRDGHGIQLLKKSGVEVWCLTAEGDPGASIASYRCEKLGIPLHFGVSRKGEKLLELLDAHHEKIELEEVAYLGDDVGDLPALEIVGMPCITRDCHPALRTFLAIRDQRGLPLAPSLPNVVQSWQKGGEGAVRDICDLIIQKNLEES